ncbi:MAG: L-threonylcarbamoyladenylate synthase, partial [Sedimentisphaerales bacterium]|nr:L-threonylcarbamoyladenylate synthase [Sedimentisphaerales bacterium]
MNTQIIKLDAATPDRAAIKKAARAIDDGGLVVFPTETVYGIACRAAPEPLARLNLLKERAAQKHYTLHIGSKLDAYKYIPHISPIGRQLIKKGWPGPLTIVFELSDADLAEQRSLLENAVIENLYKDNTIGIRCPDNVIASLLLSHTEHPVVAPSANLADKAPTTDATAAVAELNGRVDIILDSGHCKY